MLVAALCSSLPLAPCQGATLTLKQGRFYGPGNKGSQAVVPAFVHNIVLTGPLTGEIPFFNNGAEAPNVIAEVLQGGVVDGHTSSGVPINENIDTGLFLRFADVETGESARLMVVGIEPEHMVPDAKGNLTFDPHVIADPGVAAQAVEFDVMFTSGAAEIPLSLKTQQGQPGGHDQAGRFPSGRIIIGRIGDFDQDGFLDGELVQAVNSPLELIVARGDPIAQRRPWTLDVPVPPPAAALFTVNGIVQNFPDAVMRVASQEDVRTLREYVSDLSERTMAARINLLRAGVPLVDEDAREELRADSSNPLVTVAHLLAKAQRRLRRASERLERPQHFAQGVREVRAALELSGQALQILASLPPPPPA